MSGQALPGAERIRRRPDFERVYKSGAKAHGRYMTVFVLTNSGTCPRLGVAATRKIGSSVDRSRAKRLAREIYRRHKTASALDIVVIPRRGMLGASFESLEVDYQATLQRSRRNSSTPADRPGGAGRHRPAQSV
ncbi:MAG: ribonuclease P protein component [Acidobacteria bacterium]|nr:ribonuclease P protein component [Acidobacteriota bacterium]